MGTDRTRGKKYLFCHAVFELPDDFEGTFFDALHEMERYHFEEGVKNPNRSESEPSKKAWETEREQWSEFWDAGEGCRLSMNGMIAQDEGVKEMKVLSTFQEITDHD